MHAYRPTADTSLADVFHLLHGASNAIGGYLLSEGVTQTVDGFFAVALTGDEDEATVRRYSELYQPLKSLLDQIAETQQQEAISLEELRSEPTWHSRQYEVLACRGDEPDEKIARIYRESLK